MDITTLYKLSYGLYVLTSWDEGRPVGCIINSACQITALPASVAVSVNVDNYTNMCIKKTGKFAISVISENTDPAIIGTFGFKSSKDSDKFENTAYSVKGYQPVIDGCCAYVVCSVTNSMEAGTHTVFLGEVTDAEIMSGETPMTYSYYHNVIKGKSPKNAPTYIADEKDTDSKEQKIYKCSVCGYEYSGDIPFEELPDDWVCPICGKPKSYFKVV